LEDGKVMGLFTTKTVNEKRAEEYSDQVIVLKNEIADLKIKLREMEDTHKRQVARKEEDFAQERREIEHKTGLLIKQTEEDRKSAIKEAELAVREENLNAERERDKKEAAYKEKRMDEEMQKMQALMGQVMERLPNVNYNLDRTIHEGDPKQISSGDK
jgi:hypothetical protein